jgi:two-component system cell cycle sensor histidine kinase PleC
MRHIAPISFEGPEMARAEIALASARAGAMGGLAATAGRTGRVRLANREIWVRRAVPVLVALFAGALAAITIVSTRDAYDRALTDAYSELELTAGVITNNLKDALRNSRGRDPAAS